MTKAISQEQPPVDVDEDSREWLVRRFVDVGIAIGKSEDFEVNTKLPTRVKIGMTRYFGAAIPTTPITAEGLWIYKSTGWTQIV